MQTFKVNKSSWHYKLLQKHDPNPWPQDFCTYWRRVVFISALMIMLSVLVLGVAIACLYILGTFVYIAFVAPLAAAKIAGIVLGILSFASLPWLVATIVKRITKSPSTNKPAQSSLLMAKYRSWKHKYCPGIEYTE